MDVNTHTRRKMMKNQYYPNLADIITINGVTFKNRIFGAPMSNPELDPSCHMRKEEIGRAHV